MQNLIKRYQEHLNLHHATFTQIAHDDAMVAIVYKITQADHEPMILKICPRPKNYLREAFFLRTVTHHIPLPKLIAVVEPQPDLPAAVLMTCLPGTLLSEVPLTQQLAFEAGSLLAHLHNQRMPGYGDVGTLEKLSTDPRIHFAEKFHEGLDECRQNLPSTLIASCLDYFNTHVDSLFTTDGPCLIHRDFRPGNIMIHQGVIQGVIDWASGRAGFAEEDFVPYGWPDNEQTREAFLAGYMNIRPVPHTDGTMPLLQLSRAISVLGFLIREKSWDRQHAAMYQSNRRFIMTFFSIMDA